MFVTIIADKIHSKLKDRILLKEDLDDPYLKVILDYKDGTQFLETKFKGFYYSSLNPVLDLSPLNDFIDIFYKLEVPYNIDTRNRKYKSVLGHQLSELFMLPMEEIDKLTDNERIKLRKKKTNFYCFSSHGVCDNVDQVYQHYKFLEEHPDDFCVTLTPIHKNDQPEQGGWRWHKWGKYIGNQKPTTEYLYDEPKINLVYVYSIHKVQKTDIIYTALNNVRVIKQFNGWVLIDKDDFVISFITKSDNDDQYLVGHHMNPFFYTNDYDFDIIVKRLYQEFLI